MFSVVIPLYNKELSIKNTIQSVQEQICQSFEIIVINDGSTDNSVKIVDSINDKRIRLIHQKNKGVSAARNRGIQEAQYEWIAFLDGDDLWNANHLQEISTMIQKYPEEKIFVTSFDFSDKRPIFKHPRNEKIFRVENYFKEAMKEVLICTGVVIIHKTCFEKAGDFNQNIKIGEDKELWSRLARDFKIVKNTLITATYRIEAENRSMKKKRDLMTAHEYYYDLNDIRSTQEFNYKLNIIIYFMTYYFKNKEYKSVLLLFKRHPKLRIHHFIYYILIKLRKNIIGR